MSPEVWNEVGQWVALFMLFVAGLPFWVGFRRASLGDMDTLAGACRRAPKPPEPGDTP